ncbi:RPO41 Mitochondrial DNA-directed RNA polymerase [uncultured Caudovirales phage]|uniref:DNA-directed RNA polymerase n=1 Tax=uncultured Caudovirales phage TaxID=2100421 RepID=A0A6J5M2H2_9CAUD|nr:RPO41 Mitochondrial DNA-directed RNA polymerase [uncultured Caudovirales phage]
MTDASNHIEISAEDLERQLALEDEMRSLGIQRYEAAAEKARAANRATAQGPLGRVVTSAHLKVREAIDAFLADAASGRPGRRHAAVALLTGLDLDMVAHLALRTVLDMVCRPQTITVVANAVARTIEDEAAFASFKEQQPGLFHQTRRHATERHVQKGVRSMKGAMKATMRKSEGVTWNGWDNQLRATFGIKLVEMVIDATGLVQITHYQRGKDNTAIIVEPTLALMEWLKTADGKAASMSPVWLPTVVPPRPWRGPRGGGYWSGRFKAMPLVKTHNRPYLEELENADLSAVYAAVNAMQETAWAVNSQVREVMQALWDQESTLANIPPGKGADLPIRPVWLEQGMTRETMTEEQQVEFSEWKRLTKFAHESNAKARSQRLAFRRMLWVAERYQAEPAFYFPHQLDFRGRAYALPIGLNPQGDDACRGLLTFAHGVPIMDQEGADWLAIHGANTWGLDKAPFSERVQWVRDNKARIQAVAADPFGNLLWTEADSPWQFLAFCFEWAGFLAEGFGFLSSLPVAMDGTCNGLQHFSAMLRDPRGGAAVNLIPSDRPQDIYSEVRALVQAQVDADTAAGNEIAARWQGHILRSTVKRPVMTLPYGAQQYGFRDQVFTDTVTPMRLSMEGASPFAGQEWNCAAYMGDRVWDCVGQVVVAARAAMSWLQQAARVASAEGLPVRWTTPAGLPVQQTYYLPQLKRLELTFQTARLQLRVHTGDNKLDSRKQASALAPNFVHSLDAAHLMLTVKKCREEGIKSFALIHDSYATHAGNTWMLADTLRDTFVDLHVGHDVLQELADELTAQLPDGVKLPALPEKGSLDLEQVRQSQFFFA